MKKKPAIKPVPERNPIRISTFRQPRTDEVSPANDAETPPLPLARFPNPAWQEIAFSLHLSIQQLQIVQGIFDDQTEHAIASRLHVSQHTVHTHCERIYRKLGVTGRVRLVLRVLDEYHALVLSRHGTLPPVCANFAAGNCPLQGIRI